MSSLEKQCPKCKQLLSVKMFCKNKSRTDGLSRLCRSCKASIEAKYYANGGKKRNQCYKKANPVKVMTVGLVSGARCRARDKNLPFDIDLDYVRSIVGENAEYASHCPALGMALDWSCLRGNGNRPLPNSPSIDRIDPERGYVKGNVWIISYRANTIKNDATHEELKLVTKAVGEAIVNSLVF